MKSKIRLGRIHYINVLPIYYALERALFRFLKAARKTSQKQVMLRSH